MDYMDLVVPGTWNDEWNISGHDFATITCLIFKDYISCKWFEMYYVYSGKAAMRCYWTVTALHQCESRHAYRHCKWKSQVLKCIWREQDVKKGFPIPYSEQCAEIKTVIGGHSGQLDFFPMFPFCHHDYRCTIAMLGTQMHERYDIDRCALLSLCSLKIKECGFHHYFANST